LIPVETYNITNDLSGKVLDVSGGSFANGATIQQWEADGKHQQEWQFMPMSGGYYGVVNRLSGQFLDDTGFSTSDGTIMQQWSYWGGATQQWHILPAVVANGSGTIGYAFINRQSGKALDDTNYSTSDGTPVQQWDYTGGTNQQWQLTPVTYYSVVNQLSGDVLDVTGGSTQNGTAIQQWASDGLQQQQWQFVPVAGGYYAIINNLTGKALDDTGFSQSDGTRMQQWDYEAGANQQWQLVPINGTSCFNGGGCEIMNRYSGLVLDDTGFSTSNGTPIQQWSYGGTSNQQWQLAPASN